ncbi:MAG: ClpXP protease specificity-enhancing factor [Burkholderiaceae bacterium]
MNALESASTRPYLIRALYEWCADNALTPYVAVFADDSVQVPREYVQNGEIVLNVSVDATSGLKIGNEFIEFRARFGGVPREIIVPIDRVMAIYARENGQGMAFPLQARAAAGPAAPEASPAPAAGALGVVEAGGPAAASDDADPSGPASPDSRKRPALKRIK